jgi:hypothetical protein
MRKKSKTEEKEIVSDEEGKVLSFQDALERRLGLKTKPPTSGDWLSDLDIGTYFLAGDKTSADPFTHEYIVLDKIISKDNVCTTVHLLIMLPDRKIDRWCIPYRFCQQYFLHEIME